MENQARNDRVMDMSALPLILTVDDLTRIFAIGKNTAYELIHSGAVRSVRVGRSFRIPRDAIAEFLQIQ